MTLDFINKRINEQIEYLWDLLTEYVNTDMTYQRYKELYDSAKSQLDYFKQKKKEHELQFRV